MQLSRFCRCAPARRVCGACAAVARTPALSRLRAHSPATPAASPAWLSKVAGLITFALLLLPAFVRVAWFYLTSPKGARRALSARQKRLR